MMSGNAKSYFLLFLIAAILAALCVLVGWVGVDTEASRSAGLFLAGFLT
jgi:hypothetical protein